MRVKVPKLSEGINEATIIIWHKKIGEHVKKDEDIVEMATDKATFNMPSPKSGILTKILREDGRTVKVGEAIAEIQ